MTGCPSIQQSPDMLHPAPTCKTASHVGASRLGDQRVLSRKLCSPPALPQLAPPTPRFSLSNSGRLLRRPAACRGDAR
eukprot:358810-Chlamydomonas_euryale.AAC.11